MIEHQQLSILGFSGCALAGHSAACHFHKGNAIGKFSVQTAYTQWQGRPVWLQTAPSAAAAAQWFDAGLGKKRQHGQGGQPAPSACAAAMLCPAPVSASQQQSLCMSSVTQSLDGQVCDQMCSAPSEWMGRRLTGMQFTVAGRWEV